RRKVPKEKDHNSPEKPGKHTNPKNGWRITVPPQESSMKEAPRNDTAVLNSPALREMSKETDQTI
ncbi:MAG: hypothetical protein ACQESL_00005, partial [Bacteroidota bacterium]